MFCELLKMEQNKSMSCSILVLLYKTLGFNNGQAMAFFFSAQKRQQDFTKKDTFVDGEE